MAMAKSGKSGSHEKPKPPAKTREQRQAEKQALALWALLGNGGSCFGGELKPEVRKAEREGLSKAGFIAVEKKGRSLWLEVTDRGWRWAEEHLADSLPDKTYGGAFVLRAWLTRLQAFMQARGIGLAEVLGPQTARDRGEPAAEPEAPQAIDYSALRERIRTAYLDVTGGSFNKRALLSDIRARMTGVDRSVLDGTLERMHLEEGGILMGLDNPREITPAVREATLMFRGEPMHILWIVK
jgi:hypothetical protein